MAVRTGETTHFDRNVGAAALVAGPCMFGVSSFFWTPAGDYGVTGGTTLVLGTVCWIVGLRAVFEQLRPLAPRYAALGWPVAVYGAVCGGAGFAFQGIFTALHGVSHEAELTALQSSPVMANVIFWIGGPAFPLTLAALGIVIAHTRAAPPWAGLMLAAGGLLFPLARIPRIASIAHAVDALMLVPAVVLAIGLVRAGSVARRTT
jgi:hypothetical protein